MSLVRFKRRPPWFSEELMDLFGNEGLFADEYRNRAVLSQPAMNIREDEEMYELELAIPGQSREDFKVTVENGYLVIAMEKETESGETRENFTRKEFSFEQFKRSVRLPDDVDEDTIKANYQDGLLRIGIGKRANGGVQSIRKVKVD